MQNFLRQLKENTKDVFTSQDSQYFLKTALKFSAVPVFSLTLVSFLFYTILEMNYSFFVANGFAQESTVFYDTIFKNISGYSLYFLFMQVLVFMLGLYISYLAVRPFDDIEYFSYRFIENPEEKLEIKGFNKSKLIYQASNYLFAYLYHHVNNCKGNRPELPYNIETLKKPPVDKVFLLQYMVIVVIITTSFSALLHNFTSELYQEIVSGGIDLLVSSQVVSTFLDSQERILLNIRVLGIFSNLIAFYFIYRIIYNTVDGVTYGYARDMVKILKGQHHVRLRPRNDDPGQETARLINEILEDIFPASANESFKPIHAQGFQEQSPSEFIPEFDSIEELNLPENDHSSLNHFSATNNGESSVVRMLVNGPPVKNEQSISSLTKLKNKISNAQNSNNTFEIVTSSGVQIKSLDKEALMKVMQEIESINQKKTGS